jgi:amphi-Trp domain-containing protein
MKAELDVEKTYSTKATANKLLRLAAALEAEETFEIQIAGERVYVQPYATVEIEYERNEAEEQIEIELKWKRKQE